MNSMELFLTGKLQSVCDKAIEFLKTHPDEEHHKFNGVERDGRSAQFIIFRASAERPNNFMPWSRITREGDEYIVGVLIDS